MSKILCVINNLGSGGAQRQLVNLAIGFRQKGYNVDFLIYAPSVSHYYYDTIQQNGMDIIEVDEDNYALRILKMRQIIRRYQPDVILAFLEVAAFIAEMSSVLPHKWKLIVGERSADPRKRTSRRLRFFLHCHRFADYIVANSQANIDIIKQVAPELPDAKYRVIYNGLDPDKFAVDDGFTFCRNAKRNILIASSHRYVKNLRNLIEAVRMLSPDDRNTIHIDWYGNQHLDDNSFEENMQRIADCHLEEVFSFYPPTLDIYDRMRQADAVALFSHFEGFPNALCEGMMLAKPVIATRVSDIPLIIKEPDNGFLCESNDVSSIHEALHRFLTTPAAALQAMGQRNREKALALFLQPHIVEEYEHLFL